MILHKVWNIAQILLQGTEYNDYEKKRCLLQQYTLVENLSINFSLVFQYFILYELHQPRTVQWLSTRIRASQQQM